MVDFGIHAVHFNYFGLFSLAENFAFPWIRNFLCTSVFSVSYMKFIWKISRWKHIVPLAFFALGSCVEAFAAEPVVTITNIEWHPACGGSNIKVTRVDGKIVAVAAYVEGSREGREWYCHYVDGHVSSVLYKHFKCVRKVHNDGSFTVTLQYDRALVFPIKNHKLDNIPKELRKDLREVLTEAQKSKKARK